jgi:AcrR family transcriptional regulator
MTARTPTRDRMLDAAETLMREGGLTNAGIKQIVARGRAPIGSLYHHFPGGKTQLASIALERHSEKAERLLASIFESDAPVRERVLALFTKAAHGFERAGRLKSCAIGNVALDVGHDDPELRDVCDAAFRRWVRVIAECLPWRDAEARRSFAEMVVVGFEGAFVLARARQSGDPFHTAGRWLAVAADSVARRDK